jgi:Fic family protein
MVIIGYAIAKESFKLQRGFMFKKETIVITPELMQLIDQINTFNNSWQTLSNLAPEQLKALRRIATIESVGSSTRMAGSTLSNQEVEKLLSQPKELYPSLPRLASDILQLVHDRGKTTMADIIQSTNAPRSTIKKYLSMLVDQKHLSRHGQGRAIWYTQA